MKSPFDTLSWVVSSGDSTPPTPNPITGTGPVLSSLMEGDILSTKVTWGSYTSSEGSIIEPTTKEMSIDGAGYVTYDGALVPEVGESVRLRETPSDGTNTRRYTSSTQVVQADPTTVPDTFGVDDWTLVYGNTQATVTLLQLPDDGGRELLDIEYRLDGGSWISTGGLVGFTVTSLTNGTEYSVELRAVNSKGPGLASIAKEVTPATVPSQFGSEDWTLTPGNELLTVIILTLPSDGGTTITDIQYQVDSGSWTTSGLSTTGTFDITGLSNSTLYRVVLRAVNALGASAVSAAKIAIPATVPSAFTSEQWTATAGEELIVIGGITLPATGGDTITDIEYRLDGGSWVSSGGVVGFNITGLTGGVEYDVELRAVNGVGSGAASDIKPVTPTSAAPAFPRAAFTNTTRSMHSGHSLTDAYFNSSEWYDGDLALIRDGLLDPDTGTSGTYLAKSTVGGSSMEDRWTADTAAKTGIASYDALMITEAGPPPRLDITSPSSLVDIDERWDYWLRWCANTIENGAGNEVILWSIWPYTDVETVPTWDNDTWLGVTFTDALEKYGQIYETMAAYATFKMKDLYPALPSTWRVWLIPGHRFWLRIVADLATSSVPTISSLGDLFGDTIHPDSRAQYGLACLAYSCLYQTDLSTTPGVYDNPSIDDDLQAYFRQIAWEIASDYEPCGLGGEESEGSLWVEGVDDDFMPDWTFAVPDLTPGWGEIVPSSVPVNTVQPTIGGTPTEGVQVSGTDGTWTNSPTEFEYMWRIGSETEGTDSTFTPGYATAGEWCAKWVRARQIGGIWSEWAEASDSGTVARARWCKLTAGTANLGGANDVNGYCDGTGTPPAFGSIDREPIAGETLIATWRNAGDSQFVCGFAGDKTAMLAGQSVYYDSREFKGTWTYYPTGAGIFGVPVTLMLLTPQSAIAQPQTYDFRIAPAS